MFKQTEIRQPAFEEEDLTLKEADRLDIEK